MLVAFVRKRVNPNAELEYGGPAKSGMASVKNAKKLWELSTGPTRNSFTDESIPTQNTTYNYC
jgi:hypothetical protein